MFDRAITGYERLQHICHEQEQVWRHGVTLPKPTRTLDPRARAAIYQNCSERGLEEFLDPISPLHVEATNLQNSQQEIPVDSVKSFGEIQLEDQSRCFSLMANLHQLSCVDKIFCNRPPFHKARLLKGDKLRNLPLESGGEDFRCNSEGRLDGNSPRLQPLASWVRAPCMNG